MVPYLKKFDNLLQWTGYQFTIASCLLLLVLGYSLSLSLVPLFISSKLSLSLLSYLRIFTFFFVLFFSLWLAYGGWDGFQLGCQLLWWWWWWVAMDVVDHWQAYGGGSRHRVSWMRWAIYQPVVVGSMGHAMGVVGWFVAIGMGFD